MDAEAELVVPITSKTKGLSWRVPIAPLCCGTELGDSIVMELSWGSPWHTHTVGLSWGSPWHIHTMGLSWGVPSVMELS